MRWNSRLVLCDNQLVLWSENQLWTLPFGISFEKLPSHKILVKLKVQVNLTKSQQNWKDLLLEAPYSDISFEVESEIIKAHKWVLAKNCKYFANMFASKIYSLYEFSPISQVECQKLKLQQSKSQIWTPQPSKVSLFSSLPFINPFHSFIGISLQWSCGTEQHISAWIAQASW